MPLLYRFSFPSSGNASKISKFYFLLLANYKRIRGTILIFGFTSDSDIFPTELELRWKIERPVMRTKKELCAKHA